MKAPSLLRPLGSGEAFRHVPASCPRSDRPEARSEGVGDHEYVPFAGRPKRLSVGGTDAQGRRLGEDSFRPSCDCACGQRDIAIERNAPCGMTDGNTVEDQVGGFLWHS